MLDTLTGFAVIGLAVAVGYVVGRLNLLGEHAPYVLSRIVFFVLTPFLLFVVLAQADARQLFSGLLTVSTLAAVAMIAIFLVVSRFAWRRSFPDTWVGALTTGQVNSNNMGIPLSLYLLGDAAYPAPVILMQLLLLTPATLIVLDIATSRGAALGRTVLRALANPMIVGTVDGTVVSVLGIEPPPLVMEPCALLADAAVPLLLLSYGMSLYGQKVLSSKEHRSEVVVASLLKLVGMPLTAWALGQFVFGLSPHDVLVVVVLAALPTAQNVFNTAQRYRAGETIARDMIFVTTIGFVPVLFLVMVLLG